MAKKVTKKELEELQEVVSKINEIKLELGNIETTKHRMLHAVAELESKELSEIKTKLEEKYGKVNINISDGLITDKEDESSKKD